MNIYVSFKNIFFLPNLLNLIFFKRIKLLYLTLYQKCIIILSMINKQETYLLNSQSYRFIDEMPICSFDTFKSYYWGYRFTNI